MTAAAGPLVLAGFPNPISWTVDRIKGFVGDVATTGVEAIFGGLVAWVLDAVVWVVGGVFQFFLDAADPNVEAAWFVGDGDRAGPYLLSATIGGLLLVLFVLLGIVQGVVAGDPGGMIRRMAVHVPAAVLGMVALVGFTQALIRLTDDLSRFVLSHFETDIAEFGAVVGSLGALSGAAGFPATAFVVFLLGLLAAVGGIIVIAELVVRAALIYLVVALAPFAFAVLVWPALAGAARRTLELLVALVVSKLLIAVALGVAAAALAGTDDGGRLAAAAALPAPEAAAEDPSGSVTQAVGILLAGVAAFGVAAFSPLLVTKLLPFGEAALVGQGLKGAPVRAAQQVASTVASVAFVKARAPVGATSAPGAAPGSRTPQSGPAGARAGPTPATPARRALTGPAGALPPTDGGERSGTRPALPAPARALPTGTAPPRSGAGADGG